MIAHWTEACKVTFDTNGGTEVEPQIVAKGKTADKPDTTKVGYVLDYWITEEGNTFDLNTEVITSDITLKAIWAKSGALTVSFNSNGGSAVDPQTVEIWGKAEKSADPTKAGSYFVCWVLGGTVFDFDNELISTDITLDALWNTAKYYTVTFDTEGGSYVPLQRVRENNKAYQPTSPTKKGYIFQCWTTDDGREFSFNTSITSDTILSARWQRYTHHVAFDTTGGTDVIPETIGDGDTAFRPVNPSCSDPRKTFSHWELDGKEYDFTAPVTKDITLKAVWKDYKVGDIGPAGGYIFYDCDADNADGNKDGLISTECGWRYLEAAKDDYYETTHWGDSSGDNYGTKYDVGAGRDNTIKLKNQGKNDFMVYKIWGKEFYGYSDWFVPSRDELNLMYENLHKKGLGSFRNDRYWTSCEYFDEDGAHSYYYACYQDFATGKKDGHLRTADDYLRLIRSF